MACAWVCLLSPVISEIKTKQNNQQLQDRKPFSPDIQSVWNEPVSSSCFHFFAALGYVSVSYYVQYAALFIYYLLFIVFSSILPTLNNRGKTNHCWKCLSVFTLSVLCFEQQNESLVSSQASSRNPGLEAGVSSINTLMTVPRRLGRASCSFNGEVPSHSLDLHALSICET